MSDQKARTIHSNSIIKNHMIWSMGAGFIPIPIADFFAVSAVQLDMIRQMCKVYEIDFKETEGKAVITALTGTGLARIGARVVKIIPGVGSILGGITLAVLSGASTYALGEVFKKHFETGGTFLDFDPSRLKKYYDEKFEKGKQVAKDLQKEEKAKNKKATASPEKPESKAESKAAPKEEGPKDMVSQLQALNDLKNQGVLTDEEFQELKKKLLAANGVG